MIGKFNVLIVDDDPDKRNLLAIALEMAGYEIRTANDGEAGLHSVESYQPELCRYHTSAIIKSGW